MNCASLVHHRLVHHRLVQHQLVQHNLFNIYYPAFAVNDLKEVQAFARPGRKVSLIEEVLHQCFVYR